MELRWISASGKWRTIFFSSSRTQRWQRRPKATIDDDERRGCRSEHDGNPLVHSEDGFRRGFGARGTAARVELDLAEPREVAAQESDGRGDDKRRLELVAAVEREGERGESVSGDGGGRDLRGWVEDD
uniref:DUF834 domain-containing protein n=1 Tax=Oryza sativa subsp. japonica TaxID=39947 RepID=Q2QS94_ORYSJ|nr:hypothetical protein LOC_Os12g24900 [Oryza sativa Japonica Group]